MSGPELAKALTSRKARLGVLYMSGYTDHAIVRDGVVSADTHLIGKPFSAAALTQKVRDVLEARDED